MLLFPPAKINLGLLVHGKRSDGYHEIESCMIEIPLEDVLEIHDSQEFEFVQTGLTVDGDINDNLCVKAYQLMVENHTIAPVKMHLRKNIPMGAGLGGGSSDAAYVLLGLNRFFDLKLSNEKLRDLAAQLGSDCPFFIEGKPQIAKGRGEVLSQVKVDLSGYFLKIINPGIHVGTAEAYAGVNFSDDSISIEEILSRPISDWKGSLRNDFEQSIFSKYPEIASVKSKLYDEGAVYASMSGSGSTVYGIFSSRPEMTFSTYFERVVEL